MDAIKIYEDASRKLDRSEITLGEFEKMIAPLRNVVQMKHGKWESYSQFYPEVNTHWVSWECSECGYMRTKGWEGTTNGRCPTAKICENCGARMERGEQHEFFK